MADNNPPPPHIPPLPRPENYSMITPYTPCPQPISSIHPFPPPTTPTTTSTPSSSASTHRRKRSKLLRIDPPPPPQPATMITSPSPMTTPRVAPRKAPARKPDPLAPKITPPCTECGKTFWSWKALFGHMRCHPERQWRGINPPPHLRGPQLLPSTPTPTSDDQEVAASLLMLAASGGSSPSSTATRFECSSCKKTFPSHQALGGHRASHKNVKGCFAINKSGDDVVEEENNMSMVLEGENVNEEMGLSLGLGLGLTHKCNVCLKVFSSGQALGGHMRCHWEKGEGASSSSGPSALSIGPSPITSTSRAQPGLDLNLPAQEESGSAPSCSTDTPLDLRLGI